MRNLRPHGLYMAWRHRALNCGTTIRGYRSCAAGCSGAGIAPTAGLLAAAAGSEATATVVPSALAAATVQGAVRFAARAAMAGVVPASAVALTERGLKIMSLTKWKITAIVLLAFGGGAASMVAFASAVPSSDKRLVRAFRRPIWPSRLIRLRPINRNAISPGKHSSSNGSRWPARSSRWNWKWCK